MLELVNAKLESGLKKSRKNPSSLIARKIVSNHLLTDSIWFLYTLWNGTQQDLRAIQKKIKTFLWAGQKLKARHRVDSRTICAPLEQGGLGLLCVEFQVSALSTKIVLWVLWRGRGPNLLSNVLQYYLHTMSKNKWGAPDFAWLFEGVRNPKMVGSKV
jgi:hypothetical protein